MHKCTGIVLLLLLAGCHAPVQQAGGAAGSLKIATWNLEHLAEADGAGCRPRQESDYAELRKYAGRLDADVVAMEEVENAAAAARVFVPDSYHIEMSTRPDSGRHGNCDEKKPDGRTIRTQAVGIAIRNGVAYTRNADLSALALGNPDLRWGVDVTLATVPPLRVLAVHLKSGCFDGDANGACPVLFAQVPVLREWIDARDAAGEAYVIFGDFNRHTDLAADAVWQQLNAGRNLIDAGHGKGAHCLARYTDSIDHIVLNPAAAGRMLTGSFTEFDYGVAEDLHPSDHCPQSVLLRN